MNPTMPELPPIGFGTGQLKEAAAEAAVLHALEAGFRLIDTAAKYGNEEEVGRAIVHSSLPREEVIVMTKGGHDQGDHGYHRTLDSFHGSLDRLAVDYVDYYLIHWPVNPTERINTWRAMEYLHLETGKVRAIGVSNYAIHHLQELDSAAVKPAVNQVEFHPFIYSEQRELLEYCKDQGIDLVGYATFGGGQADQHPNVSPIASRHGRTINQVLARWSMQHGVTPLVRSGSADHIKQNIELDFELSADDMMILDGLSGRRLFPNPQDIV